MILRTRGKRDDIVVLCYWQWVAVVRVEVGNLQCRQKKNILLFLLLGTFHHFLALHQNGREERLHFGISKFARVKELQDLGDAETVPAKI